VPLEDTIGEPLECTVGVTLVEDDGVPLESTVDATLEDTIGEPQECAVGVTLVGAVGVILEGTVDVTLEGAADVTLECTDTGSGDDDTGVKNLV